MTSKLTEWSQGIPGVPLARLSIIIHKYAVMKLSTGLRQKLFGILLSPALSQILAAYRRT